MFKIGQKVVCINANQINVNPVGKLRKNEIYTIERDLGYAVYLKEIKAPHTGHYNVNRFRLIDDNWTEEILCKLLEEVEQEKLVYVGS